MTASAIASASVAPSTSASVEAPLLAPPDHAGTIACGQSTCVVAKEVCCVGPDQTSQCGPLTAKPPPDLFEPDYVGPYVYNGALNFPESAGCPFQYPHLEYCDDSDDCAKGEVCCKEASGDSVCVRHRPGVAQVCERGEMCVNDATCRAPGARCMAGRCHKGDHALRCGTETCGADVPICCEGGNPKESHCVMYESACSGDARLECKRREDCLNGEKCCADRFGTSTVCNALCEETNVCRSDADCRDATLRGFDGQFFPLPACVKVMGSSILTCQLRN